MTTTRDTSPFVEDSNLMRNSRDREGTQRKLGTFESMRARFFTPAAAEPDRVPATSPFVEESNLMRDSRVSDGARPVRLGRFETMRARFFSGPAGESGMLSSNFNSDDMDTDEVTTSVGTGDIDEALMVDVLEDNVLQPLSRMVTVSRNVFNYYSRKMRALDKPAAESWTNTPYNRRRLPPLSVCLRYLTRVIHPSSSFAQFWVAFIMIMDMVYSAFFVPISVAFCEIRTATYDWCSVVDLAVGGVYAANIILGFCIGYVLVRGNKPLQLLSHRLLARFYIMHGSFVTDFLSSVPWIYSVIDISGAIPDGIKYDYARALLVIRILRVVRILPLLKNLLSSGYAAPSSISAILPASSMYAIIMSYTAAIIINFYACMMFTIAKFQGLGNSWVARYDYANLGVVPRPDILGSKSKVREYVLSLYWIVTTMTTVGYGDIVPVTVPEQVAMVVVMLSGVMVFGILVSSISESMSHASDQYRRAQMLRTKLSDIHHWLKHRQADRTSSRLILAWYSGAWKADQELSREEDILDDLPWHLRRDVSSCINKHTLRRIKLFGLPQDQSTNPSHGKRFHVPQIVTQLKAFGENSVQKGLALITKEHSAKTPSKPTLDSPLGTPPHAHSSPAYTGSRNDASTHNDQSLSPTRHSTTQHNMMYAGGRTRTTASDFAAAFDGGVPPDATVVVIPPTGKEPISGADVRSNDTRRGKPPLHSKSLPATAPEIKDSGVMLYELPPATPAINKDERVVAAQWTQDSNHGHGHQKHLTVEGLLPFLASIMLSVEAMPLQDICTEGDVADSMWILEEGEVTVTKTARGRSPKSAREHDFLLDGRDPATETQEVVLKAAPDRPVLIGHGSLLRLDMLECMYCLHTIRARTFCQLWVIKMDVFRPILKHNPHIEARIMNHLRDEMASHLRGFHHEADPAYPWIDICYFLRKVARPEVCETVADKLQDLSWDKEQQKLLNVMRCVARSSWKKNVQQVERLLRRQSSLQRLSSFHRQAAIAIPSVSTAPSGSHHTPSSLFTSLTSADASASPSNSSRSHGTDGSTTDRSATDRSVSDTAIHNDGAAGNDAAAGTMPAGAAPTDRHAGRHGKAGRGGAAVKGEDGVIEGEGGDGGAGGVEEVGKTAEHKRLKKVHFRGIPLAFRRVRFGRGMERKGSGGQHSPRAHARRAEPEARQVNETLEVGGEQGQLALAGERGAEHVPRDLPRRAEPEARWVNETLETGGEQGQVALAGQGGVEQSKGIGARREEVGRLRAIAMGLSELNAESAQSSARTSGASADSGRRSGSSGDSARRSDSSAYSAAGTASAADSARGSTVSADSARGSALDVEPSNQSNGTPNVPAPSHQTARIRVTNESPNAGDFRVASDHDKPAAVLLQDDLSDASTPNYYSTPQGEREAPTYRSSLSSPGDRERPSPGYYPSSAGGVSQEGGSRVAGESDWDRSVYVNPLGAQRGSAGSGDMSGQE